MVSLLEYKAAGSMSGTHPSTAQKDMYSVSCNRNQNEKKIIKVMSHHTLNVLYILDVL